MQISVELVKKFLFSTGQKTGQLAAVLRVPAGRVSTWLSQGKIPPKYHQKILDVINSTPGFSLPSAASDSMPGDLGAVFSACRGAVLACLGALESACRGAGRGDSVNRAYLYTCARACNSNINNLIALVLAAAGDKGGQGTGGASEPGQAGGADNCLFLSDNTELNFAGKSGADQAGHCTQAAGQGTGTGGTHAHDHAHGGNAHDARTNAPAPGHTQP